MGPACFLRVGPIRRSLREVTHDRHVRRAGPGFGPLSGATGTIYDWRRPIAEGAERAGGRSVRGRPAELAPDGGHRDQRGLGAARPSTGHRRKRPPDDIVGADAVIFGSPTRFGNISAQLKQFLDTLGPRGSSLLADKVYSGFVSTSTAHGGQDPPSSPSTTGPPLRRHHGHPRFTDPAKFADGNPYGTSS